MNRSAVHVFLFAGFFLLLTNISFAKTDYFKLFNGPSNLDDSANALHVDDVGNAYVTGGSEGDIQTIKYDRHGNIVWSSRIGLPNEIDFSKGLVVDCKGNTFVAGVSDFGNNALMLLARYDQNGTLFWVGSYDPGGLLSDEPKIAIHSGRIYLVPPVDQDIYILGLDEAGSAQWGIPI